LRLPESLVGQVIAGYPTPIADACNALEAAEFEHQRRDRVVEVHRAVLRWLSVLALSARIQFGVGPAGERAQVADQLGVLSHRALTDGTWLELTREILRPWKAEPEAHPLPELVQLFHGSNGAFRKSFGELLGMRKKETVAHAATGDVAQVEAILDARVAQLCIVLELLAPLHRRNRLVVPWLTRMQAGEPSQRKARLLAGITPPWGHCRLVDIAGGEAERHGTPLLVDEHGCSVLILAPAACYRAAVPGQQPELFLFDGLHRGRPRYVAFPTCAEHLEEHPVASLASLLEPADSDQHAMPDVSKPFRGLRPFLPEHRAVFHGREADTEHLSNLVRRFELVTLTGPSGCGKTSLLRAGLEPALADFDTAYLRPGARPWSNTLSRLDEILGRNDGGSWLDLRHERPSVVGEAVVDRARAHPRSVLLMIDQAEELFTMCGDDDEVARFGKLVGEVTARKDNPVRAVLAVRGDFFTKLASVDGLTRSCADKVVVLDVPEAGALIDAMVRPAAAFGYRFEDKEHLQSLVGSLAGKSVALPLLQFFADKVWERRDRHEKLLTRRSLEVLGGIEGALASHADAVLEEMTPTGRSLVRSLMVHLVGPDDVRTTVLRADLLASTGQARAAGDALDRLIAARLVVARDADGEDAEVELVHDILVRHWDQLGEWLEEDKEHRRYLHQLKQQVRVWKLHGMGRDALWRGDLLSKLRRLRAEGGWQLSDDERLFVRACEAAEKRQVRVIGGLVAAAMLILATFGVVMKHQRDLATIASQEAEVSVVLAEARSAEARGEHDLELAYLRAAIGLGRELGFMPKVVMPARASLERILETRPLSQVLTTGGGVAMYAGFVGEDTEVIVTGQADRTVAWDTRSGRFRKSFEYGYPYGIMFGGTPSVLAVPRGQRRDESGTHAILDLRRSDDEELISTVVVSGTMMVGRSLSPTGGHVATCSSMSTDQRSLEVFAVDTGERLFAFDEVMCSGSLTFSSDGATLAAGLRDGRILQWDTSGGLVFLGGDWSGSAFQTQRRGDVRCAFLDNGHLICGVTRGTVTLWDTVTREVLAERRLDDATLRSITVAPSSGLVALAYSHGDLSLIRGEDLSVVKKIDARSGGAPRPVLSPDGTLLAWGGDASEVDIWAVPSGRKLCTLIGHTNEVKSVQFSSDSRQVVTAARDGSARLWTLPSGPASRELDRGKRSVDAVAWSEDGRYALTGTSYQWASLWDASTGKKVVRTGPGGKGRVRTSVAWLPGGDGFVAISNRGRGWVWSRESRLGSCSFRMPDPSTGAEIPRLEVSPDGAHALIWFVGARTSLWDVRACEQVGNLPQEVAEGNAVFSADGRRILVRGAERGSIDVWGLDLTGSLSTIRFADGVVVELEVAHDGAWIAVATTGGKIYVLDGSNYEIMAIIDVSGRRVTDLLASPTGQLAVITFDSSAPTIWDPYTAAPGPVMLGHAGRISAMAFSPDGAYLATGSTDTEVRVWDVRTGQLVRMIGQHNNTVHALAFSPDGSKLLSGAAGGSSRIASIGSIEPARAMLGSGRRTNMRVCRHTHEVVPVLPFPEPMSVWAPEQLCHQEAE
jgi:WD40 repeat protein